MTARIDWVEGGRIALFSLATNRLRTLLTTTGVGIGVATLLAILSVINGLNASVEHTLSSIGTSTLYIQRMPWARMGAWWKYRNRPKLTFEQIAALAAEPHVVTVAPAVGSHAEVTFLDQSLSSVPITGTTAGYLDATGYDVDRGRMLGPPDDANHRDVAVLGDAVVQGLFGDLDPLGRHIRVGSHAFTVIGTLAPKGGSDLVGSPDLVVLVPLGTFKEVFGRMHHITGLVKVDSPQHLDSAIDHITGTLRRLRHTPPEKPDDFSINRADQLLATYKSLTRALFGVVLAVGLITLLVGGIGIMNIMLVSVRERTREIGLRRALGARKRTIVIQFLLEAAAVSATGGALGAVMGLVIARTAAFVGPLHTSLQPLQIAGGVGFAALMGLIFGIWPAARAANFDPVEALRYE